MPSSLAKWASVDVGPFDFRQRGSLVRHTRDTSFRGYVERTNPELLKFEHVPRLVDVAQRLIDGDIMRLIVCLTPRYFKTEVFSRLLSGYALERHPTWNVGLASYGAELAWSISEEARHYYQADGGTLDRDTRAKKRWRTEAGGEMWAAGVGGPLLGFGYHLGIVDDPTDPEKAHSPTYQKRFEEWWPSKFLSRQEPDARIVVVMQRLGTHDPIDFLYRREVGDDTDAAPEHWHVVVCDEVKSDAPLGRWDGPKGLPPTCTLEPDPREDGEVLAPSRFSPEDVEGIQRASGTYVTQAQRQQRPSAPIGDFWQKEWFETYDTLPDDAYNGGWDWDLAYTKDEANSASAGVQSYRGKGGKDAFPIYIEDVDWEWVEFPELVAMIRAKPGPHHIEAKASGKSAAQVLRRERIAVREVSVSGDKFARSAGVQPIVSGRRVFVNKRVVRKLLEGERQGLLRIRAEQLEQGKGDLDVNDAFVAAITRHTQSTNYTGPVSWN